MKRFSAQYIITGTGDILKRGIITTDDDGLITDLLDTGGRLPELQNTAFYNGIIIPGFVNCHCHLELSVMKGVSPPGQGLGNFIRDVREKRPSEPGDAISAALKADRDMYNSGISACADICNSSYTFEIKDMSRIDYINLLEVFGIDPAKAAKRISEINLLFNEAAGYNTPSYIVPHSLYSLSSTLLSKLKNISSGNRVTSIHFMESPGEEQLLRSAVGELYDSYLSMGITGEMLSDRVTGHAEAIHSLVTSSGNLILVHNTYAGRKEIESVMKRGNTFWCLCPLSNLYIENCLPPVDLLRECGASIVIGTDSLASNNNLSILGEMKEIASAFPGIELAELVKWATANGAEALGISDKFGTIEKNKTPGLVLLENISLDSPFLSRDVTARRLI